MRYVSCFVLCLILIAMFMGSSTYAADPAAAGLLSAIMPGAGEWYNSGFSGSFPWMECIAGAICPCVQISSIFDAVNGNNQQGEMRIDFWTAPR
jgi:hypothetical protein